MEQNIHSNFSIFHKQEISLLVSLHSFIISIKILLSISSLIRRRLWIEADTTNHIFEKAWPFLCKITTFFLLFYKFLQLQNCLFFFIILYGGVILRRTILYRHC